MRIAGLEWDVRNVAHLAECDLTQDDVEAVCSQKYGPLLRAGRAGRGEHERFLLVGRVEGGDFVTVVLKPLGNARFRPITGWASMPDERRRWHRSQGGKAR